MTERDDGSRAENDENALPLPAVPTIAGPAMDEIASAPVVEDEPELGPSRVGCRTELRGWAGAHLHGAVRPRRRAAGRGRPPGRWC